MVSVAAMQTRIGLARSEASRLSDYLGNLSPAAWEHSTACDRWQVGDVVAHLVWIGEFYVTFITRALAGDLTAPPGSPKDAQYANVPAEDFYSLKAFEYRESLGDDLLPTFTRRFDELGKILEQLTPDDYERPCFYHSGNRPVWTLADLTVQELTVHAWDIQSHLEPDAHLSPECQPVLLERVVQRPQPGLKLAKRVRFELSGAVDTAYDLAPTGDGAKVEPAVNGAAESVLKWDVERFILMLYGRASFSLPINEPG